MNARSINGVLVGATVLAVIAGIFFARLGERNHRTPLYPVKDVTSQVSSDAASGTSLIITRKTPGFGETIDAPIVESLTLSVRANPGARLAPRTHPLTVTTSAEASEPPLWRKIAREDISLPLSPIDGYSQLRPMPRLSPPY